MLLNSYNHKPRSNKSYTPTLKYFYVTYFNHNKTRVFQYIILYMNTSFSLTMQAINNQIHINNAKCCIWEVITLSIIFLLSATLNFLLNSATQITKMTNGHFFNLHFTTLCFLTASGHRRYQYNYINIHMMVVCILQRLNADL